MYFKGKLMTRSTIIDKLKSLYDEIEIIGKGTFSGGSNKTCMNSSKYRHCPNRNI
jgi:hypothetical protein